MFSYVNYWSFSHRTEQQQPRVSMETSQPHPDTSVIRATSHSEREYDADGDEYDENEPVPDLEKDDMMARRTGSFQKASAAVKNQSPNQFLPVPGSVKYSVAPVSAMKPLHSRPKLTERMASERYRLLCWSAPSTNKAYLFGKDGGFTVLIHYMACSTNINKSLWTMCSWSGLTVWLFWSHVSMSECLQLDAWCDFLCIIYILKAWLTLIGCSGWILGAHMTWHSVCLVWTNLSVFVNIEENHWLCLAWLTWPGCGSNRVWSICLLSLHWRCKSLLNHLEERTAAALLSVILCLIWPNYRENSNKFSNHLFYYIDIMRNDFLIFENHSSITWVFILHICWIVCEPEDKFYVWILRWCAVLHQQAYFWLYLQTDNQFFYVC